MRIPKLSSIVGPRESLQHKAAGGDGSKAQSPVVLRKPFLRNENDVVRPIVKVRPLSACNASSTAKIVHVNFGMIRL